MTLVYQDGFAVPSDVPLYVAKNQTYALGTTPNVVGNGVGARGSPMPMLAYQLDDIPSVAPGWVIASGETPTAITDPPHEEAKFRFHLNAGHVLNDDPIRAFGQPGASHPHQFFGNLRTNARSTFASLRHGANRAARRAIAASTASGGPYNASGYWIPAMLKGGKVIKPGQINGYYAANPATQALRAQRLPRGLRYVTGCNMEDPLGLVMQARLATANAAIGFERYVYRGNGFNANIGGVWSTPESTGWMMLEADMNTPILTDDGKTTIAYFVNPDGSDPWGGRAGAGCFLKAFINGPVGVDGTNLWSPGGFDHVYNPVKDQVTGDDKCIPSGAYYIPELQIVPFYEHQGFADYGQWTLSSHNHAAIMAGMDPSAWPSGADMHADWFGSWDDRVFGDATGWQHDCVSVVDGVTMHLCQDGVIRADGTRLLGSIAGDNAPDGSRTPQVALPEYFDPATRPTLPSFSGPVTVPAQM